jgi:Tetraspanin family
MLYFTAYPTAPILLITDSPALILLTFSSLLLLLASLVGITGTLLNSRPILAVYVLLLFPSFISFISVGYITYKKANFSLDAKVSEAWNLWYSPGARTVLQGALRCCGWSSPLHGGVASGTCYTRSPLPGCHGPLVRFERDTLSSAAETVFSLVPLHLANIFVGLLCANHVTHRFGKGITPARYRLTVHDVLSTEPDKQRTKQAKWPVPPRPVSTGHGAFREDRQTEAIYRQAHGKVERVCDI